MRFRITPSRGEGIVKMRQPYAANDPSSKGSLFHKKHLRHAARCRKNRSSPRATATTQENIRLDYFGSDKTGDASRTAAVVALKNCRPSWGETFNCAR